MKIIIGHMKVKTGFIKNSYPVKNTSKSFTDKNI